MSEQQDAPEETPDAGETSEDPRAALETALGYTFTDRSLLQRALTHPSYANEREDVERHNQRLEFLGDAVLELVVATRLFADEELGDEGALTRQLSALVCERALADKARQLHLGQHLLLGRGEEAQGGRTRRSILCDAYEALMAAVYLDGGYHAAAGVINALYEADVDRPEQPRPASANYKGELQRMAQLHHQVQPTYSIVSEEGPDHNKTYVAEALIHGERVGLGEGGSKKQAEQAAAQDALANLHAAQREASGEAASEVEHEAEVAAQDAAPPTPADAP